MDQLNRRKLRVSQLMDIIKARPKATQSHIEARASLDLGVSKGTIRDYIEDLALAGYLKREKTAKDHKLKIIAPYPFYTAYQPREAKNE